MCASSPRRTPRIAVSASDTAKPRHEKALSRRLAPPLAFVLAICLLVICCYDSGYSGLPPTEKRYAAAKAGITNLKRDEKNSKLREPWEKLAGEFRSIYEADPAWPNRPAALFRAAESLEELASRSFAKSDARKAVECYESLALRHAGSRLADDALFRAARLRAAWLRDDKGALALLARLKKQYPRGDMVAEATALEKAIKASASGRTAPEAVAAATKREAKEDQDTAAPKATPAAAAAAKGTDLPLRYRAAKSRMTALRSDPVKTCWRQPWEDLREEFLAISQGGKKQPLAAGALFHAAACQEALARCSNLTADFNQAQKLYQDVAKTYPASNVADDALLAAARLHAARASGREKAQDLLDTLLADYPKGDMAPEARRLRTTLAEDAAPAREARRVRQMPELQVLSWDSPNRNLVEIVLELSAPAKFTARRVESAKGAPARLELDLEDARVVSDVRKGVTVQGSLLQAVRVRDRKEGGASLQFDFREVRHFDTRSEDDPYRIVLSVAAGKASLPRKGKNRNQGFAEAEDAAPLTRNAAFRPRQVSNMASQLGLTVRKVFIDAGHGGKDPGTSHNDILERMVTLDVAQRLGRLLEANGLEVAYSRRKDMAVSLSERTRKANAERADLFVSIHVNASENAQINGFETYYLDLASNPQAARVATLENAGSDRRLSDMQCMLADVMLNARVEESRRLAADIQRLSLFRLKKREYTVRNNGVKSAPFHVLLGAQMPAILVEVGYCTNRDEARNLAKPAYRHALAEGLAEGILAYRDRLLKRRTADNSLTNAASDAM
ncbi:MAG: N-acetylmuramoyl-L-alanine amidase [Desulfovibrio sp.]|nr:N-acetylmuramoyl-L-alanine amidase [Desulfovibrio sp.]